MRYLFLFKNKILLIGISVIIFFAIGILFWWYQDFWYHDSLVAYIPEETILYTHLRADTKIPTSVQKKYFGALEDFLGESQGSFEEKYLPNLSEVSFFIFIDPASKKEIRAMLFRARTFPQLVALPHKEISRGVFVVAEEENFFEHIERHHNRDLQKKLQDISDDKAFSFFIEREELAKYAAHISFVDLKKILDTYMSRWQPFLFGAIGDKNGKLVFSLSDFSASHWNTRSPLDIIPLNNFSLLYKADHSKSFFEENGFSFEGITFKDAPIGVALSLSAEGKNIPLFFFELIEENDDVLEENIEKILGKFISVRRSFTLPDGEVAHEVLYDASAFSLDGEHVMVDGKPYPLFVRYVALSSNSYRVFISPSEELLSGGENLFSQKNDIKTECLSGKAVEVLKFKKDILPESLKNIFIGETYLLARTSETGFSVEGCEE